jgi:hypothetical protein
MKQFPFMARFLCSVCALSGTLTPSVVRLQQLLKNVRDKDILSSQLLKEAFLVCSGLGEGIYHLKYPVFDHPTD